MFSDGKDPRDVEDNLVFLPPRRWGSLFHAGLLTFFVFGAVFGLYRAAQAQIGFTFLLYLLPGLIAIAITPFLTYSLFSLRTASYRLERDGIRLRWGLRVEEIPITEVVWVRLASELNVKPPPPLLRLPGAILGIRHAAPLTRLGVGAEIEYMASTLQSIVLVGTEKRVYALSPADSGGMLYAYQRLTELGSLTPLRPRSVYPRFLLGQAWSSRPARLLMLVSLVFSLVLFVWVSLALPTRSQVHLGFHADGTPGDVTPIIQLLLLPVLNGLIVMTDFLVGLFFFRRKESRELSYIIWAAGALIPVIFIIGVYFILNAG
jgi:hypothetical protein